MADPMGPLNVHAGCVALGPMAILIRGASRSGKSTLGDFLVESARAKGHFAQVISDDRTLLTREGGRVLAQAVPDLAGLQEVFALGVCREDGASVDEIPVAGAQLTGDLLGPVRLRLLCDLVPEKDLDRLPDPAMLEDDVLGIRLPRIWLAEREALSGLRTLRWALRRFFPKRPDYV